MIRRYIHNGMIWFLVIWAFLEGIKTFGYGVLFMDWYGIGFGLLMVLAASEIADYRRK